ncbi:MAG: alpha/beta fold hydrolase [Rhodospirillales bacterium]|nr:MAG: alpha/beta fold hydrolase [Rhodospirillales bacterium]
MRLSRIALGLSAIGVLVAAWVAAGGAVSVPRWPVGAPPTDLPVVEIAVDGEPGIVIRGWAVANPCACGVVVLLHGSAGTRESMLSRARFLHRAGYSSILVDMRAHGRSDGAFTTFGGRESLDARAVIAEARRRFPGQRVAAIGFSLGGAALLLGDAPAPLDALVVEAVYATLEDSARNRVAAGMGAAVGATLPWLLYAQMPLRFGVSHRALRPVERIGAAAAPVFVLGGERDPYTPPAETRALFDAARSPKEMWIVPGAHHWDLHDIAGAEYERRILAFLGRHLKAAP